MIDRIGAEDFSTFYDNYYRLERPVIITDAAIQQGAEADALWSLLRAGILRDGASRVRPLWLEANHKAIASVTDIPAILVQLFQCQEVCLRRNFVRAWFSRGGHVTPWHYDGNDLHVSNLQLSGSKRWQILSPDTPLPCIPFMNVCLPPERSLHQREHYEFVLEEGELLFLPRYWFHRVESVSKANINVNWVFTSPPKSELSQTSRRVAELRRLKSWIPGFYDNASPTPFTDRTQSAPPAGNHRATLLAVARRLIQEIARIPLLLVATPWLVYRLAAMRDWRRLHGTGETARETIRQKPSHQ